MNVLFAQDVMLLEFLKENAWQRPVYFASTVAHSNLLGFSDYLYNAGIVNKLLPVKGEGLLPEEMERNLLHKYRFTNLNDPEIRLEQHVLWLFTNYRSSYLKLAEYYLQNGNRIKAEEIYNTINVKIPQWRYTEKQNKEVQKFKEKLDEGISVKGE